MSELMTTTYSMWRLFRNCRMACKWRYIDELVPLERDPNLIYVFSIIAASIAAISGIPFSLHPITESSVPFFSISYNGLITDLCS